VTAPLAGVRVVELAGIGPGPFAAMLLADLGADVTRVDRPSDVGQPNEPASDIIGRGRRSIAIDLKQADGRQIVLDLVARADVLLEGFRPGVTERLGLGPDDCLAANPALVYGRMTGWGQHGPLARQAGHDIGYLALSGALDGLRRAGERPVPPMNLLGDFGGGALYLVMGVLSALFDVSRGGAGRIVDAAIVDGAASLTNFVRGLRAQGSWTNPPGGNLLDTGAPFYDVYTCADGREIAVGALEPRFYAELLQVTGADDAALSPERRADPAAWPAGHAAWSALFATRTRDEWAALFEGTDACVAPVLALDEAPEHPQLAARATFVTRDGVVQAAPAPRFGPEPLPLPPPATRVGRHTDEVLRGLGHDAERIRAWRDRGVVA
jgi:alpha-methylacyl-CoA racemase